MLCNFCKVNKCAAGQGFTQWTCKNCGKTFWHHNTAVPQYCEKCSEILGICEQCGKPINLNK